MSVYKELLYAAEQVEKLSVQVFPDAADFGVPVFSNDDPIIRLVKQTSEMYEARVTVSRYSTGATQTISIMGMDEWNTGKDFEMVFTYVHISSTTRRPKVNGKTLQGYIYVAENGYKNLFR